MNSNNPLFPRATTVEWHRKSRTPEYRVWCSMKARCNDPKHKAYKRYGGRGLAVCDQWLYSFENFLADMGKRPSPEHSLDRIDNDLGYSPNNCRWATRLEQANNQSTNRRITFNGKTQTVTEWAREMGLTEGMLRSRLDLGWSVERSLTEKKRYDGLKTLAEYAREVGLPESTLSNRLKRGWSLEKAISLPQQKRGQFRYSDEEVEAIKQYRADGHTLQETADRFGCSNGYVSRIVNGLRR